MSEIESPLEELMDIGSELEEAEITAQAHERYSQTDSYQGVLASRYRNYQFYYRPPNGDQWPEDQAQRPGMIHITHNIIQPAVDTESRIEAMIPRITLNAGTADEETRKRAELAEKVFLAFLEQSSWDIWLPDATKVKAIFGKTFLHPFWNVEEDRPDVTVVEMPENLRVGWGSSDFRKIDWTLYEYAISPLEALSRFPEIGLEDRGAQGFYVHRRGTGDHADPIDNISSGSATAFGAGYRLPVRNRLSAYEPSDYEADQLRVWDYWFKDRLGEVYNAIFVEGVLAEAVKHHPELPDIPYIPIEHDHEPGFPDGMGMVEPLIDIQIEMDRALSHMAQIVADEIDPAWQVDADSIQPGMVPRAGEITPAGEGRRITAIEKPINQTPLQILIDELYKSFHFNTGLPEILFSLPPSAQTAGRALAVQIESASNRIDVRRRRLYRGLTQLLNFWGYMIVKVNPQVDLPDGSKVGLADVVDGFKRWKIVAPEITPRDDIEHTNNTIQQVQAKLISLETAMDSIGVDAPIEEMARIQLERTNPKLFPGDTQAYLAVESLMMQLSQQIQQLMAMQGQMGQQASPEQAMQEAQGQQIAEAQQATPTLMQGDNQETPGLPATVAGGPPPPGGPQPGGLPFGNQTLIRSTPTGGAQALQQIKIAPGA